MAVSARSTITRVASSAPPVSVCSSDATRASNSRATPSCAPPIRSTRRALRESSVSIASRLDRSSVSTSSRDAGLEAAGHVRVGLRAPPRRRIPLRRAMSRPRRGRCPPSGPPAARRARQSCASLALESARRAATASPWSRIAVTVSAPLVAMRAVISPPLAAIASLVACAAVSSWTTTPRPSLRIAATTRSADSAKLRPTSS